MAPLAPCPACERHVRITEARCPFCDADVRGAMESWTLPRAPTERLSRAALAAFAAGTLGAAACNSPKPGPEPAAAVASSVAPEPPEPPLPAPAMAGENNAAPAVSAPSAVADTRAAPSSSGSVKRAPSPEELAIAALASAQKTQESQLAMIRPGMAAYGAPPPHSDPGSMTAAYGAPPMGTLQGPKGNSAVGAISVTGGPIANAQRVVAGMRAGFRNCYNRGLAADPTLPDTRGTLTIDVAKGGEVTDAKLVPTTPSASVAACVEARARAAQFDPPESGSAKVTVTVSFVKQ